MFAKLSVDQALMKARSYVKKNETAEAQKLYEAVLLAFPKNKRAQQALADLNMPKQKNITPNLSHKAIDQLIILFNQGQFSVVIEQAEVMKDEYSETFSFWNILGASEAEIGMFDKAINSYKKAISLQPHSTIIYTNMGLALKNQGKLDSAIAAYKKSISLNPNYAEAYNNIGNALKEQGNIEEAIEAYKRCISLKPDYAVAYSNMGNALKADGNIEAAIHAYKKSISLKPDYAFAYSNMGNSLKDQGKLDEAIKAYNHAVSLKPDYVEAYSNLGVVLTEQGKLDEAIKAHIKSLSLKPDNADAYNNIGNTLNDQGKFNDAMKAFNKALSLKPNLAEAYSNMGNALKDQGKFNDAIKAFNKALSLKPDYAEAYNNLGALITKQGKIDDAIQAYKKSISLKPDYARAHQNLSYALLSKNRLKEGLAEYEWRWKTNKFLSQQRYFSQPLWDGKTSLTGKRILLWSEQGVGDTINWSSCISFVSSQSKRCVLECQEKLVPLLKRSFPNVQVKAVDRSLDTERDDFDVHLPMGSLYKHFIEEITKNTKIKPFLIADPVRVNFWKERLSSLGKGPYIGISWKSADMSAKRLPNYADISELSPILKIPDVTFVNLQYVDFETDLIKTQEELDVTIHNFDDLDHYDDIDNVAALSTALDIVVSTKTTVPLISAGVGTSTKLANWRQSAWNNILLNPVSSSIDMFERDTLEPWDNVFNLIAKDILKLTKK